MVELNDQNFYYKNIGGRLLGNKAREDIILEELAKLDRNDFFLEVGCAQGYFEKIARRFCQNVFGGDYTYEKLPVPEKEFAGCHFIGIDAEKLPFKDNSFDFVLCTEVLEHVPKWGKAFEELQRVAKKKILVTVPLEKGVFWQTVSIFRGMHTRGHLHKIGSSDLKQGIGKEWNIVRHEVVATPSRHVNKVVGKKFGEKIGIYTALLFEKNETKPKTKAKRK